MCILKLHARDGLYHYHLHVLLKIPLPGKHDWGIFVGCNNRCEAPISSQLQREKRNTGWYCKLHAWQKKMVGEEITHHLSSTAPPPAPLPRPTICAGYRLDFSINKAPPIASAWIFTTPAPLPLLVPPENTTPNDAPFVCWVMVWKAMASSSWGGRFPVLSRFQMVTWITN